MSAREIFNRIRRVTWGGWALLTMILVYVVTTWISWGAPCEYRLC